MRRQVPESPGDGSSGSHRTATGSDDHPIAHRPAGNAVAEPGDGPGRLMALRDDGTLGREGAVDQTEVGVADVAEGNLHQHLPIGWPMRPASN